MAKRNKTKRMNSAKKSKKITKDQTKVVDYLDCLFELHKLQGVLLAQLQKEL